MQIAVQFRSRKSLSSHKIWTNSLHLVIDNQISENSLQASLSVVLVNIRYPQDMRSVRLMISLKLFMDFSASFALQQRAEVTEKHSLEVLLGVTAWSFPHSRKLSARVKMESLNNSRDLLSVLDYCIITERYPSKRDVIKAAGFSPDLIARLPSNH